MIIQSPAHLARGLVVLALLGLPPSAQADPAREPQAAAPAAPSAGDLLFERAQLANAKPGQPLTYRYSRKVSDPDLGESFDDRITLKISEPAEGAAHAASAKAASDKGASDPAARDVRVDFFTGERHRAAGPFPEVTGNPVMILFLENHVRDLSTRLHGNPRYFKNAIRAAMRDKAEVTRATIVVGGRAHEGWRVKVMPFKGDPNAQRMRGLEGLTYQFEIAPDLPGEIADIKISADTPAGRLFEESLTYDPKGT